MLQTTKKQQVSNEKDGYLYTAGNDLDGDITFDGATVYDHFVKHTLNESIFYNFGTK